MNRLSFLPASSKKVPGLFGRVNKRISIYIIFSCLYVLFSSCDQDFQPLEANDEYFFSMYGYLDASADTQWVRVTPVREQVEMLSDESDVVVTLENLGTGQEIMMNDSLFREDRNYLNFWTETPIEYRQSYRLKAEQPDGAISEVGVLTPEEMPVPKMAKLTSPGMPPQYFVLVDKQVNLADIQVKYYIHIIASNIVSERTISFSYRNDAEIDEDLFSDYYSVEVDPDEEIAEIERLILLPPEGEIEVVYRQIFVAASGMEWDEKIESLDDVTYALPQSVRNVENGLGYVIGIDSKYIPYEVCTDQEENFISCGEEERFWYK